MLKKITLISALTVSAFSQQAQAADAIDGWTYISNTANSNFYVKNGTLKQKQGVRSMLIQQVPSSKTSNDEVLFRRVSIPVQACLDEYGEISMYDLGGRLVAKFDYVKGGSSVAAFTADLMCIDADKPLK
ncbi:MULTISPECIES: hypothetical protein [unclassified Pantoea]|uniref:hypothetical protein n=1 Tax=unclassified Pantoea TaxID=2630326 RepID=UPI001CD2A4A1|nr:MULTISPECIES: hypothetical protein [unclassified Pantoea]MCA1178886.1 hypothetical protein [Pantoea sp. alder69]MCA1253801.1 hypothetical protein [Pantoea sp. alder70]MCA1267375.1 hypothetical protein [Pantoea sp. alder81]